MIEKKVLELMKDNKELIDHEDWEEVYKNVCSDCLRTSHGFVYIGLFTEEIIDCGVNPLEYMSTVPEYFLYMSRVDKTPNIPQDIKKICSRAFAYCEHIESVNIPISVVEIGLNAFLNCTNLKDIYYDGTLEQFRNIKLDEHWISGTKLEVIIHCKDKKNIIGYPIGNYEMKWEEF